jgi:hypothetical protein
VEHQRNHPACNRYQNEFFGYRALRSQKRSNPIAGFDENYYVNNTEATARSIQDLLAEFSAVRHSNLFLLKFFRRSIKEVELPRMCCFSSSNRFYYDWTSKTPSNIFKKDIYSFKTS